MLIAAAGPLSNLLLAVIFAAALWVMSGGPSLEVTQGLGGRILTNLIRLNVLLALFNLVPIPPLDGGNVLAGLLQGRAAETLDQLRPYGFVIIYILMLTGILWAMIDPIANVVLRRLL